MGLTTSVYGQDYGKYSLPHTTSLNDLQKYIGQHVQVFKYKGYTGLYSTYGHDEIVFHNEFGGQVKEVYTISSIKVKNRIEIELLDNYGNKIKTKVNIDGKRNYKGMQSCKSFFLVDKFNEDKTNQIGQILVNSNNENIAKVTDCQMIDVDNSYPQIRYEFQSVIDYSKFWSTLEMGKSICKELGRTLTNPKVKATYKIVGVHKVENAAKKQIQYIVRNMTDYSQRNFYLDGIEKNVFAEDLSGHYVSSLTKVEKPSNNSIRYGKTTVVKDYKNISKYSYVDNVIDILILGSSEDFSFILKNISNNSIKVIWNEAMFVDFDGNSSKIMHNGIKYSQREEDQPSTTIIKGAKINDAVTPTTNVYYDEGYTIGYKTHGNGWKTKSMYPENVIKRPGQLRLMLPIQIKDVINEYTFIFDVEYVFNHPERLNL